MDKQIVYNSVTCLECNETIVSYYRHDYKICGCKNEACVDGGTAYLRYGAKDMSKIKLFAIYADDDYEIVRKYATRGSRGKDGNRPLTFIPLCEMEDDHLEACLDYGGADWHMELIHKEIEYRKFKEHQKENIIELMNMDSYSEQNIPKSGTNCENELKNYPYCSVCGACGEEGCCSALVCSQEDGDYCKTYLNELRYAYAVHMQLLTELYDELSEDLQEKWDNIEKQVKHELNKSE